MEQSPAEDYPGGERWFFGVPMRWMQIESGLVSSLQRSNLDLGGSLKGSTGSPLRKLLCSHTPPHSPRVQTSLVRDLCWNASGRSRRGWESE